MVAATKEAAGGGVHAVADFVGNTATADRGAACLGKGGVLTVVGLAGGVCTVPLIQLTLSTCSVGGLYTGTREQLQQLLELVDEKKVTNFPRWKLFTPHDFKPAPDRTATVQRHHAGRSQRRHSLAAARKGHGEVTHQV